MIWLIYNSLFLIAFIVMLPKYLLRMRKRGGYKADFMQRLGVYSAEVLDRLGHQPRIWVHAVSVGELYVAFQFIEAWRAREPDALFVLSTTTSTGHALAKDKIKSEDVLIYFPTDLPWVPAKVLKSIRPRFLVLIESEFWPNMIRKLSKENIPVFLINGRISDRSFKGYLKLKVFTEKIFHRINRFYAQGEQDASRLIALGAKADRVQVVGSAKYEQSQAAASEVELAREALASCGIDSTHKILLGGSTWRGEEEALLGCYLKLREQVPELRLVLVPRHMERRQEVEKLLKDADVSYTLRSRQLSGASSDSVDVYVVDTTGELKCFYAVASIIFVGKSLTDQGGQNVIEPAVLGLPIIVGPNMQNFPVITRDFLQAKALVQVRNESELSEKVASLLASEELCSAYGAAAQRLVESKVGAVNNTVSDIARLMKIG